MSGLKVCFIAYIFKKPSFFEFFDTFSEEAKLRGHQFFGLHLGRLENEKHSFEVDALPFSATPNDARLLRWENQKSYLPKDLKYIVDFEPVLVEKVGTEVLEAVLVNYMVFLRNYLESKRPDVVILGHQFSAQHQVAIRVCNELKIPLLFNHPGVLPGTMCFEAGGQMAEGELMSRWDYFKNLEISEKDKRIAEEYLAKYQEKVLFRPGKKSVSSEMELNFLKVLANRSKLVLYAGIADFRTGVQPRSYPNSAEHSPWVNSSLDGLKYLLEAAEEFDFFVIYKPHPIEAKTKSDLFAHPKVLLLPNVTISDCLQYVDGFSTICSSSAYEALLHKTPLLLLGKMQAALIDGVLSPSSFNELRGMVKTWLSGSNPVTHSVFVEHVALLLKAYYIKADPKLEDLDMPDVSAFWDGIEERIEIASEFLEEASGGNEERSLPASTCYARWMARNLLKRPCGISGIVNVVAKEISFG